METLYKQLFRVTAALYPMNTRTPTQAHKDPAHHRHIFITRNTAINLQPLKRGIPPRASLLHVHP